MGNPFAVKKSTTVQRTPDEVYPQRKGLHKPQYLGNSPMDQLFARLESFLDAPLAETTVHLLFDKIMLLHSQVLSALQSQDQPSVPASPDDTLLTVVQYLLGLLDEVHACAIAAKETLPQKDLLTISLHDIKTFGKLVSAVIVFGVSPALLALRIGVPLEKRRLKDFGTAVYKPLTVPPLSEASGTTYTARYAPHAQLLQLVYTHLHRIFAQPSDVRDLLLKGSGYADYVTVAIALATVPYFDSTVRMGVLRQFDSVEALASTYDLYQDYTLLVATASPAYFKQFVMARLQRLPSSAPKGDGVLSFIEFVLGLRDNEQVDISKFDHVARVLLLKPKQEATSVYFESVGRQCYDILVNINRPTIASCVGHFLEQLWLRNPRVATDFFLKRIWAVFKPLELENPVVVKSEPANLDLVKSEPREPDQVKPVHALVLLSEAAVNNNINVLLSLTQRALPADLMMSIFRPVLVPVWCYHVFARTHKKPAEILQNILISYLTLVNDPDALDILAQNIVAEGDGWRFRVGPNSLVEIVPAAGENAEQRAMQFLARLDAGCNALVDLLRQLEPAAVLTLFVAVLGRWLRSAPSLDAENPFVRLVDLRVVETIGREFSELLAQTPGDILLVVYSVLAGDTSGTADGDDDVDSDDDDDLVGPPVAPDVVAVVLQLLSAIMTEIVELDTACRTVLGKIRTQLGSTYAALPAAQSLVLRIDTTVQGEQPHASDHEQQRQVLARAVASLNDPLVPIRAHGLYLLRQLVEAHSPVVAVDFVVRLHLLQLKDPDPFVYLNVIKGLDSLLQWDASALPLLTAIYGGKGDGFTNGTDASDDAEASEVSDGGSVDLDERLRVGEVLLRYVEQQGEAFSGELAREVCDSALSLIQRRGAVADNRLRMSAMSVLGACCNTNPLGMVDNLTNALDCAVGILQLETGEEEAVMRRAAIVLISDLVLGTSKTDKVPFPASYREKVLVGLRYVRAHDLDLLVQEQAQAVLDYIDELVAVALETE